MELQDQMFLLSLNQLGAPRLISTMIDKIVPNLPPEQMMQLLETQGTVEQMLSPRNPTPEFLRGYIHATIDAIFCMDKDEPITIFFMSILEMFSKFNLDALTGEAR